MTKWILLLLLLPFAIIGRANAQSSLRLSNTDFKYRFLEAINRVRTQGCNCGTSHMPPAAPLAWNNSLANSATNHALDMGHNNYFSHQSRDGRTLKDRLLNAGYNYKGYQSYTIGENIAQGQQSITEVMDGWFKSVGHCKNLMNPAFKEIGVAEYHFYWVQDFGGRIPFANQNARLRY